MEGEKGFNQSEFLDLLPEIVFEIDTDLNIKFLNKACERILGYRTDELINNKISLENFVIPSDLDRIKNNLSKNFKGVQSSGNSYGIYNKAKEELTLEIYNNHIKSNGKVIGLRCIAIDITEKEENFRKLSSQEKHFRQIFHNLPIPYQSLDINGTVLDVNPAWEKILGFKKNEIVGKNFASILTEENKINFKTNYQNFIKKSKIADVQFDLLTKSGSKLYVNYNGSIEYDENGQFYRTHCVFNDITIQREAEQTLIDSEQKFRELNATKDKFFSIIAHDLKNPFNDLMGFTQLLALNIEKYDTSKIIQFANIIHQSSKLAHNLLENLLDWSRSQTGVLKFNPEKIIINRLIEENIELLESTAQNKNIKIYYELDKDIFAFADKNMLNTILRNLISNAIKYTKLGGHINISSYCDHKICEISISDSGIGINEQNIGKIFKIDESFSTPGTERERGTGLGLILCKEFVEKNKGEIWVKSEPDKGSTFTFTLPLPEPEY